MSSRTAIQIFEDSMNSPNALTKLKGLLPPTVATDSFIGSVITYLKDNPKLLYDNVPQDQLMIEIRRAAKFGLSFGKHNREACICTYKSGKQRLPQFQLMYRGCVRLARNSGEIFNVRGHTIYAGDKYKYEMSTNNMDHQPAMLDEDRGEGAIGFYAVAETKWGQEIDYMTLGDVNAIRLRSPSVRGGSSSPWDTDFNEMAKKTVTIRLCKTLPLSDEVMAEFVKQEYEAVGVGIADAEFTEVPPEQENQRTIKENIQAKAEQYKDSEKGPVKNDFQGYSNGDGVEPPLGSGFENDF